MSDIADELERMAKVFSERVTAYEGFAAQMTKEGDETAATANQSVAGAFLFVVDVIQKRAAELRQQRSGPTYKPQPKPKLASVAAEDVVNVSVGDGATVMHSSKEYRVRYEDAPIPGKTIRISIERHNK